MLLRSLLVGMAALALFSPYNASAQGGATSCHATPQEARREVPWGGNAGDIEWSADQPDCKVDAGDISWVKVSVLPPVSGGNPTQRTLRYSVDTNFAPAGREGKIRIGDSTVTIAQAAGPAPGMAYSPSHLEFVIGPNGAREATKVLFVGSEEPLAFTATPEKTAPWVQVKTSGSGDGAAARPQRSFEITVSAAGKDPGVYKTDILLEAPGAANPKELVPVTMTVEGSK
jgi:hypothetical protein